MSETSRVTEADIALKKDHINAWLDAIPKNNGFLETESSFEDDAALAAKDLLDCQKNLTMEWLQKLDKLEVEFRETALKYHKIPHDIRHTSTLLDGLNPMVVDRVSEIFETNHPRFQEGFFGHWFQIKKAMAYILRSMKYYEQVDDDEDLIRSLELKHEQYLDKMPALYEKVTISMIRLHDTVVKLAQRTDINGGEALAQKHSREGGLFRLWISTLPELDHLQNYMRSEYVEFYAAELLQNGVKLDQYWSRLADMVELVDEE
jgi:hypothetical protein